MFFVYILESQHPKYLGRFYVGYAENTFLRLDRHNSGKVKSTKPYKPWKIVYTEEYVSAADAMKREKEIKNMKSRVYIKRLIEQTCPEW